MVGLERDHLAQQPLHLVHAVELLGHHRLLVEQVDVVRVLLVRLLQHGIGLAPQLHVAQHLGLGEELGAAVGRRLLRRLADQFARFLDLALARQQRGAARLHLERALRVVDLGEPALGALVVVLLLGRLREQQPGLGAALLAPVGGRGGVVIVVVVGTGRRSGRGVLELAQIGLERGDRLGRVAQFDLQRAQRQPGRRHVRREASDRLELRRGIAIALRVGQHAHVVQAHAVVVGLRLQERVDDGLGRRRAAHQAGGEHGHRFVAGIVGVRLLQQRQRLGGVGHAQPGARQRHACGSARGRLGDPVLHDALDQRGRLRLVAGAREEAGQRLDQPRPLGLGRELDQRAQGLDRFVGAIERHQQLDQVAVRLDRARQGAAPGHHRGERLVAGACLQGDLGGAAEQLLVAPAPRRIEHHLIGRAGLAAAQLDLADQQLVEELGVEPGVLDRRIRRGVLRQRRHAHAQQRRQQGTEQARARAGRRGRHR